MPPTSADALRSTRRDVGQGVYALSDLRAYLAFSGRPQDADKALPWLTSVLNPVRHQPRGADYSFSDLVSLFVVRELLKRGVRPSTMREAENYLRRKWDTDRPFVSDEIQTDGQGVFVDDELIAGQIESADRHGQQVLRELVKDRLAHVHYHEGTAAYWTPTAGVLVDPRVQFGEPVIAGTRIPTEVVADVARTIRPDLAASQLRVSLAAARTAVAFQEKLARPHA